MNSKNESYLSNMRSNRRKVFRWGWICI